MNQAIEVKTKIAKPSADQPLVEQRKKAPEDRAGSELV